MALTDQRIIDRLNALEERVAELEEALAPKLKASIPIRDPEVYNQVQREKEDVNRD